MALEIERKFLVERLPPELEVGSEEEIAQGYLVTGDASVRLRRQGERTLLTGKRGRGLARDEVEVALDADAFEELWPLTEGRRLEKSRLTTTVDARTVEIDVYKGRLAGLIVAEVEFDDTDAALAFSPPSWFARELTGDPRFSNQRLAAEGLPEPQEG
jgi:CYTH domain-containing protein